jgi:hypothetical protein
MKHRGEMTVEELDLLYRLAISNPLYTLRILEGDEDLEYWIDRIMNTETAELSRQSPA